MRALRCDVFPVSVVLITEPEEYEKITKRTIDPHPYPCDGEAIASDYGGGHLLVVLGCVDDEEDDAVISMLTHEAVHLAQDTFRYIAEQEPGVETQAYLIQYFSKYLVQEWRYHEAKKAKVVFSPEVDDE